MGGFTVSVPVVEAENTAETLPNVEEAVEATSEEESSNKKEEQHQEEVRQEEEAEEDMFANFFNLDSARRF